MWLYMAYQYVNFPFHSVFYIEGNESHSNGTFEANDVHHQYAITFIPPACPEHLKSKGSLSHVHVSSASKKSLLFYIL